MKQEELYTLLKSTGLPTVYYQWDDPPELPYLIYLFAESDNFGADNVVYYDISNFDVELYSDEKDVDSEATLETLFSENEIYYEKYEEYIESEKMYQVLYEIQI